jgi:hypothetical protein
MLRILLQTIPISMGSRPPFTLPVSLLQLSWYSCADYLQAETKGAGDWADAFNKAKHMVSQLTVEEKVRIQSCAERDRERTPHLHIPGQSHGRYSVNQRLLGKHPRCQTRRLSGHVRKRCWAGSSRDRLCQLFSQWNPCRREVWMSSSPEYAPSL